ncbi:helix-turn-helix transcriptional regulator [Marseilla massiliensis]|uniref:helix-turn-helix domain-containing protein n=1 Tax=Marseilla massiliensis TaxID=1841864 RepID=UPI0030C8805F
MEQTLIIDSIESYNNYFGFETQHPLVAVVDLRKAKPESFPMEGAYDYRVYALFLKQTYCGDITYGRQPYDYQEGTVTSFAPGQVVHVKHMPHFEPNARGLLFHPDLIRGTSLGKGIGQYSFFDYSSREALHLSDDEKKIFTDCLNKIEMELGRPIDQHSKPLICRNIELLLDYCMRFYDRQFITRREANHDVLTRFENELNTYFRGNRAEREGLPSVKYFAERCFLSPNYFGDLVKKETGRSPQEFIQGKIIDLAKDFLAGTDKSVTEIAYCLGFQYPQHFNRYFKRGVGMTPMEYRRTGAEA